MASSQTDVKHIVSDIQRRSMMPLWQAPEAWLQLLVNREEFGADLPKLMSVSWAMCEAVLRCMDSWRLVIQVCMVN
jgi:hypothetical protein